MSSPAPLIKNRIKNHFRIDSDASPPLSPASGIAFTAQGNYVIADDFNHRIQIYDAEHKLINQFGQQGKGPGDLHYPRGVTVDAQGHIYVADSWNHRVQKFTGDGTPLARFGSYGEDPGELNEPYDVHIIGETLIVVERYNHRLQFFDLEGNSLGWVGSRALVLEEQLAFLFETPQHLLSPPVFEFPTSIARDSLGHFYIADSGNHRIVKFNAQWKQVDAFGHQGSEPGQFQYPMCVAVARNDLVYVADMNNDRVQVFTPQGLYLDAIDRAGEDASLKMPCLVKLTPEQELVVGLTFNTTLYHFDAPATSLDEVYRKRIEENSQDFRYPLGWARHQNDKGPGSPGIADLAQALDLMFAEKDAAGADPDFDFDTAIKALHYFANALTDDLFQSDHETLFHKGLELFQERLNGLLDDILDQHRHWDSVAESLTRSVVDKETLIQTSGENPVQFDREFFELQKREKVFFRTTRLLYYHYRKAVEQFGEYCNRFHQLPTTEQGRERFSEGFKDRMDHLGNLSIELYGKKEKNEIEMAQGFSNMGDQQEKWKQFRVLLDANSRAMDFLKHLRFEFRIMVSILRFAAQRHAGESWLKELLTDIFIVNEGSFHPLPKILLRTQDDWEELIPMDLGIKDLMDTWIQSGDTGDVHAEQTVQKEYLEPVPYDAEELNGTDLVENFWSEALPLQEKEGKLLFGRKLYSLDAPEDLLERIQKLYDNQISYNKKNEELFQQLRELSQQKLEQQAKLQQIDARDKKAPLPINSQIMILDFQTALLRRMIVTLEFNEMNNLNRMILGCALLALQPGSESDSDTQNFFNTLRDNAKGLEQTVSDQLAQFKAITLEHGGLEVKHRASQVELTEENLRQSNEEKKRIPQLALEIGFVRWNAGRFSTIRNQLRKFVDFDSKETSLPTQNAPWKNLGSWGKNALHLGTYFNPIGVAPTPDGGLWTSDFDFHRIYRFSADGVCRFWLGGFGNAPGKFKYPVSLRVDASGNLFAIDQHNERVQKFSPEGNFLASFGDRGPQDQRIGAVQSLSIDLEGLVWVADGQHGRIQIYDSEGNFVRTFQPAEGGKPMGIHHLENGDILIGDDSSRPLKRYSAQGKLLAATEEMNEGHAFFFLTAHPEHGIIASDFWLWKIYQFDANLKIISVFDRTGKRGHHIGRPGGLTFLTDTLVVANYDNHRVQFFELPLG